MLAKSSGKGFCPTKISPNLMRKTSRFITFLDCNNFIDFSAKIHEKFLNQVYKDIIYKCMSNGSFFYMKKQFSALEISIRETFIMKPG